jgi:predicted transposase YbfD/YdcC
MPALTEVFGALRDWRKTQGQRYAIKTVLTVALLAILSGENSLRGIARWALSKALGLKARRIPGYETIRTVLRDVDVNESERGLRDWAAQVAAAYEPETWSGLAVDGKTLCGSQDGEQGAVHVLSVFCHDREMVLGQQAVNGKTNEIPVARDLLKTLGLEGMLITCDALHTQRETAELIVEKGGPIYMVIDDNQPRLKADIALLFDRPPGPAQDLRVVHQLSKGHGRIEKRTLSASVDLNGYIDWPGHEQALRLERSVYVPATDKTTVEVQYGLLSLAPDQIALPTVLSRWRGHWSRDVVMGEDASLVRSGHAPQTFAALRNAVISLVHCLGQPSLSAARRHFALHFKEALSVVGIS